MTSPITRRTALKTLSYGTAALGINGSLALLACKASNEIEPSEREAIRSIAEDFRRQFDAPGLSVTIARDGHTLYEQAFGMTGHDASEALTSSNLFRIASISKTITSAAIFSLIEKGSLRLDDTVFGDHGILGTQFGKPPYGPGIEQITIDHLLTHSCGGWDNGPGDPMFTDSRIDQAELISFILDHCPLKNLPGMVYAYSNVGFCILGRVIEKISGQSYADFVQSTILSPCGITDMQIGGSTLDDRATNEVTYYDPVHNPYIMNVGRLDSAGGWIASPADLVRFVSHVDGFDAKRNILKLETIRRMTTHSDVYSTYARGWSVNARGNWWHLGNLPGTTSVVVRTATRYCWAALINTRREQSSPAALDDMVWQMVSKVRAWRSAFA
jgi:CubicO group peptidase (beta-lactamase class C family)